MIGWWLYFTGASALSVSGTFEYPEVSSVNCRPALIHNGVTHRYNKEPLKYDPNKLIKLMGDGLLASALVYQYTGKTYLDEAKADSTINTVAVAGICEGSTAENCFHQELEYSYNATFTSDEIVEQLLSVASVNDDPAVQYESETEEQEEEDEEEDNNLTIMQYFPGRRLADRVEQLFEDPVKRFPMLETFYDEPQYGSSPQVETNEPMLKDQDMPLVKDNVPIKPVQMRGPDLPLQDRPLSRRKRRTARRRMRPAIKLEQQPPASYKPSQEVYLPQDPYISHRMQQPPRYIPGFDDQLEYEDIHGLDRRQRNNARIDYPVGNGPDSGGFPTKTKVYYRNVYQDLGPDQEHEAYQAPPQSSATTSTIEPPTQTSPSPPEQINDDVSRGDLPGRQRSNPLDFINDDVLREEQQRRLKEAASRTLMGNDPRRRRERYEEWTEEYIENDEMDDRGKYRVPIKVPSFPPVLSPTTELRENTMGQQQDEAELRPNQQLNLPPDFGNPNSDLPAVGRSDARLPKQNPGGTNKAKSPISINMQWLENSVSSLMSNDEIGRVDCLYRAVARQANLNDPVRNLVLETILTTRDKTAHTIDYKTYCLASNLAPLSDCLSVLNGIVDFETQNTTASYCLGDCCATRVIEHPLLEPSRNIWLSIASLVNYHCHHIDSSGTPYVGGITYVNYANLPSQRYCLGSDAQTCF